jgi:hypothetical protein
MGVYFAAVLIEETRRIADDLGFADWGRQSAMMSQADR